MNRLSLETVLVLCASFLISAVLTKLLIPLLRRLKFGQTIREEGNPEHLKKQGTPTMGGIAFLISVTAVSLYAAVRSPRMLSVLLLTLGFGLVGFADDFLKVVKKRSEGFKPWQKLACQFIMTGLFAWYCYKSPEIGSSVVIPFTGGRTWDMGLFYLPFVFIAVLGTDNGTNFTDGLDGLCASVTSVIALFFMLVFREKFGDISILSAAFAGALMGFLIHNAYPAKLFMGDTGSLSIGGFVSAAAIVTGYGWLILIFGFIYLIEVLSVILQVGYFKLTHGKRIFKMAPIHHHFELSGWSETRIVAAFSIVTLLLACVSVLAM